MSFSGNKTTKKTIDNLTVGSICQEKLFDLQSIENKRIEFSFTASDISSDGGLLLVKNIESQTGIINVLVNCIGNTRHQSYVDHSFSYQARSWENQQRVIDKIEVTDKGTNTRFIVTDLWEYRAKAIYEKGYCG